MFRLKTLRPAGLALVTAIALAVLSVNVERIGSELAVYGNLCGPSGSDFCYEPVLKGGFPLPYLFDMPGVSVERQLSFGEDILVVNALVLDIAIYFVAVFLIVPAVARRRAARMGAARRERT
jgi:hypothetical protein